MAAYTYVAINLNGVKEKGVISADNPEIARRELRNRKLTPVKVKKASNSLFSSFFPKKISLKNLVLFTRQMHALLLGGVALDRALKVIGEQSLNATLNEQSLTLSSRIKEGFSFTEALKEMPQSFDSLYISLISAGERAGDMTGILEKTAQYLERRLKIQQEITGALVYPAVLVFMAVAIVSLMLIFVVPSVVSQFENLNQELPLLTIWLIGLSSLLSSPVLWITMFIFIISIIIIKILGIFKFKPLLDKYLLKIPVLKGFLINADLSRFTSSLSILRNNDIPIIQALNIATNTVTNSFLRSLMVNSLNDVSEGSSIAICLHKIPYIQPLVVQLIDSGERSGELEDMLTKAAEYLDLEFKQSTKLVMSLLEPLVVVVMGIIVAGIVVAVLLPLIQMNSLSLIG